MLDSLFKLGLLFAKTATLARKIATYSDTNPAMHLENKL